jgi:hypothetical protein
MIDAIDFIEMEIQKFENNNTESSHYYFIKGFITGLLLEYLITQEFYQEYLDRINNIANFTPAD